MMAANNIPGKTLPASPIDRRLASRQFHTQNKIKGSHSQLVLKFPSVICPILKVKNAQLIMKPRMQVVKRMVRPRQRWLSQSWPEPGIISEANQAGELFEDEEGKVVMGMELIGSRCVRRPARRWL